MWGRRLPARHSEGTKVSGSAGAPGATSKTHGLSRELNSKPTAAGNARCDEQAAGKGYFIFLTHQEHSTQPNVTNTPIDDMGNLNISLKFKPGLICPKEIGV